MSVLKRRYDADSDGEYESKPDVSFTEDEGERLGDSDSDKPLLPRKKARTSKAPAAGSRGKARRTRTKQSATASIQTIDKCSATVAYGGSDDEINNN